MENVEIEVSLDHLRSLSQQVRAVRSDLFDFEVRGSLTGAGDVGSPIVQNAVATFDARWRAGREQIGQRADAVGQVLDVAVTNYQMAETTISRAANGGW